MRSIFESRSSLSARQTDHFDIGGKNIITIVNDEKKKERKKKKKRKLIKTNEIESSVIAGVVFQKVDVARNERIFP